MKPGLYKILGIAVLLILTSRGGALAGVVMDETSLAAGPRGSIIQNKTIYVEGNKQEIEQEGITQVTDLDKNLVYIIDNNRRVFAEVPLRTLSSAQSDNLHGEAILTRTRKRGLSRTTPVMNIVPLTEIGWSMRLSRLAYRPACQQPKKLPNSIAT
jgi:hypothetical protein